MKYIILRISGTFGSGKTTAARDFLKYPNIALEKDGKIQGYQIDASSAGIAAPIFLLGSYKNVCGGCDGIPTQAEIAKRAIKAHAYGHVLMEGALLSGSGMGGAVTQAIEPTWCGVYAFLDTPLDECISRVRIRRTAAGNEKPFDPKNVIKKFESVVDCYKNMRTAGCNVKLIDHTNIHQPLVDLIKEFENDE